MKKLCHEMFLQTSPQFMSLLPHLEQLEPGREIAKVAGLGLFK